MERLTLATVRRLADCKNAANGSRMRTAPPQGRGRRNCEHALKAWSVRRRCHDHAMAVWKVQQELLCEGEQVSSDRNAAVHSERSPAVLGEANTAVIAAIVGNLLITVTKLVAAVFSGSAAMLAEAIHSIVDAANDGLILLGIRRSRRPANEEHPLGYGHELYFWSLVVGILIFGLGGGVSVVMGVVHIVNQSRPDAGVWSYVVLAAAAIFEGISWYFGFKAFRKEQRGRGIVETIRRSKNPSTFSVLLEDSAALLGLVLAFIGLSLAAELDQPWIDGASSVAIGVLLCGVAVVMVYESKGLLVGEGMEPAALAEIRSLVAADRDVEHVGSLLSLYLGPDDVLLAIELRVLPQTSLTDLRSAIARIKKSIQQRYPRVRHVFLDT